ncbi:MAG: YqjK-like family protein [Sulfuritalea sp.]|nr:YqjK-like family protein [Sulfuritalea sp.]
MNSTALELALKKQRLLIASESLRAEFGGYAAGLAPAFTTADYAVEGARWLRRNPLIAVAAGVALAVARPKRALRWVRRGFLGWQAWRQLRNFLERRHPGLIPQRRAPGDRSARRSADS